MPDVKLSHAREIAADWIPRLVAQQLTGLREVALRSAVARGEVRIIPDRAGRYAYNRADCERLRARLDREARTPIVAPAPRGAA